MGLVNVSVNVNMWLTTANWLLNIASVEYTHTHPTTLVAYRAVRSAAAAAAVRSTGLGVTRDRISRLPIDLRRRPYNTLAIVLVGRVVSERLMGSVTLAGSRGQCAPGSESSEWELSLRGAKIPRNEKS